MLVHQILKEKATDGVLTLKPTDPVSDAVALLIKHRIGTVVVSPDGSDVTGILSERDIVRELGKKGAACLTGSIGDIMTSSPKSCHRDDTADSVLERMTAGRFRHMPVLEKGNLIGLISIGDVVKAKLGELAMEKQAMESIIMGT